MMMADWSELPEELLDEISSRCNTSDNIRIRAVCKSWRQRHGHVSTSAPQLPWLMMLSNPTTVTENTRDLFSLSENRIYTIDFPEIRGKRCCGSFHNTGWLMTVDEELELRLFHPWRRIEYQLPHQCTFSQQYFIVDQLYERENLRDLHIRKGAMSEEYSSNASSFMVMVIFDLGCLGFCRLGDQAWTTVQAPTFPSIYEFDDVIYYKGMFYALHVLGQVVVCHIDTGPDQAPYVEELTAEFPLIRTYVRTYLVADSQSSGSGRLFLVGRRFLSGSRERGVPHKTLWFDVYEVSLEKGCKKMPVQVESLGDRMLFLGHNSSMLVRASEFPGFKGNCIYFTDDYFEAYFDNSPFGCLDLGVFNMVDRTVEPLFLDRMHPGFSPPIWVKPPEMEWVIPNRSLSHVNNCLFLIVGVVVSCILQAYAVVIELVFIIESVFGPLHVRKV